MKPDPRTLRTTRAWLLRLTLPALFWAAALAGLARFAPLLKGQGFRPDFSIYMLSGLAFDAHQNPYRVNFAAEGIKDGMHYKSVEHATDPPTFILLFAPLSKMAPQKAFWLWTLINCAALIAAMWLLVGAGSGVAAPVAASAAALVVLYPPIISSFHGGKYNPIILLMFALMMRCVRNQHQAAAGVALAVTCLTRLFPLLIIGYLALEHRYRALRFTIIWLAVGMLLTLVFFGVGNTVSFVQGAALSTTERWLSDPRVVALDAYISRWYWTFGGSHLSPGYEILRRSSIICADLLLLAATVRATLSVKPGADHDFRLLSLWIVTSILLSPSAWVNYLVLLIVPFAQMAAAYSARDVSMRTVWSATISVGLVSATVSPWCRFGYFTSPWLVMTVGESAFLSLAAAYLSAYFFVVDRKDAVGIRVGDVPIAAWRRLAGAEAD